VDGGLRVGVVDERRAAERHPRGAHVGHGHRGEPARASAARTPSAAAAASVSIRLRQVVRAAQRRAHLDAVEHDAAAPSASSHQRSGRTSPASSPASSTPARGRARPAGDLGLVGRGDGERRAVERVRLLAQHAGHVAEPLEVLLPDRREHDEVGLDDRAQRAISPGAFVPISTTASSAVGGCRAA
jgi:hypothetical protein